MAPRSGIKFKDGVTPRLFKLHQNINTALQVGMSESMAQATKVITGRVISAHTETGRRRVAGLPPQFRPRAAWWDGRGPGRVESGRLLASARWQLTNSGRVLTGRAGFINPPSYTAKQELGDGKIPPMLAFQLGHTSFAAKFDPIMQQRVGQAIRSSVNNKFMQVRGY